MNSEKYLNSLNKISGIGAKKLKLLIDYFGNPQNIWQADIESLKQSGIGEKNSQNLFFAKKEINPDEEWEKLKRNNINIIHFNHPDYPKLLKEISNPPFLLYIKGNADSLDFPAVAIVGARRASEYGLHIARTLAKDLAASGITVVSGMAFGIDSSAHRGALDAEGKTIAVLGDSLDDQSIYPRNNFNLSREIIENGALVSEYSVQTIAGKLTFPARNRIIAGLTLGTIVVEAESKSGALITARMALEANREVFSVPGSILSPQSAGTNELIKNGARVVTGIKDILEELDLAGKTLENKSVPKETNKTEEKILKILSGDPIHIDNVAKLTKLQITVLASTLSMMEIKGWVKNIGGQNYIII
jgi:DNA processing protein